MAQNQQLLQYQLDAFRKKYYTDKIIRGVLILTLVVLSILFITLLSEGWFGFSAKVRTFLVYGLSLAFVGVFAYMIAWPFGQLLRLSRTISDLGIAEIVKDKFPQINDKLINFLQLKKNDPLENTLLAAALERKAAEIAPVPIQNAVDFKLNNRYLKYLLLVLGVILTSWLVAPEFMSSSSNRLIQYNQEFLPPAPFAIEVGTLPEEMVSGEDYELSVTLNEVRELPKELYIYIKKGSETQFLDYTLSKEENTSFSYTFSDVKEDFSFFVGNPEIKSNQFDVSVLRRPFIKNFVAVINYPEYTNLGREVLDDNVGDFKVLKGSTVSWQLRPQGDISKATFVAKDSSAFTFDERKDLYKLSKRVMERMDYFIALKSETNVSNIDTVKYRVDVIPDRYPTLYIYSPNNDFLVDLDPSMSLDLEVADDFGFSKMNLFYRFVKSGGTSETSAAFKEYPLSVDPSVLVQPQNYVIDLTQLGLQEGDELEYYIKVWDNDAVSGPKAATSATYKVIYPTLDAKYDEVSDAQDEMKSDLDEMEKRAEDLQNAYQKMQEKLLDKKRLSFDDKKEVQRLVEEHQSLMQQMENVSEDFEETKDKLEQNQMISEQTLNKYEELNEYMKELDNPKVEELLKQLEEQMQNLTPEDLNDQLEDLRMSDREIQKSIERTMELMKQLEVQQKMDELRNKLENIKTKQDLLNEKVENAESPKDLEQTAERQEDLQKQMEQIQKDVEQLDKLKQDTRTPDDNTMDKLEQDSEIAEQEMENAGQQLEKALDEQKPEQSEPQGEQGENKEGDRQKNTEQNSEQKDANKQEGQQQDQGEQQDSEQGKEESPNQEQEQQEDNESSDQEQSESQQSESQEQQSQQQQQKSSPMQQSAPMKNASQSQKNASKKIQEMMEQLGEMQSGMQMQQDQQNLENLRELIENLLTLSFDQEDLRDEVKKLKYGDPSLKEKGQQQKKLQDDMGLVRDSLESLANKVFQIKKYVLDESQKITENMERSQIFFRSKQISMIEYHQQSAMTSINNLANMLSDVMQQVQEQMMNAQPGSMCPKPGQKPGGMQKMSEAQRRLNQQMQQMMQQGQIDPKKLAEMAARQEQIRKQLQEAHEKIREEGGKALGDMGKIMQDMQETETELINKQLTHETLKRQQEILSRLLQADRSVRQRELDKKRESRSGKEIEQRSPEELSLEEYKNKIRQELLKSNKLEYSNDFMILIEQYFKKLEKNNE